MKEFDPSLDEIVSAYVDGVATPDERALVEGDPELVERAATFGRVRDGLAAPTPADDALRSSLIARALADTAAPAATVHTLHHRRMTALGPIVAAAAVIALFFGLGTWLVASQENNDNNEATSSAAAPSVAEDLFDAKGQLNASATTAAAGGRAGAGNQSAATGAEAAKAAPPYLGAFADEPSLRQALDRAREAFGTTLGTAPAARAAADAPSCRRTDPPDATIYSADLRGRPVTIVVTSTRADLFDDATCVQSTLDLTPR